MKRIIALVCLAFSVLVGCAVTTPDDVSQGQDESSIRVQRVMSSVQAASPQVDSAELQSVDTPSGPIPTVEPSANALGGGETQLKCIVEGDCASCCHNGQCCSACGNGPVVCT